MDGAAAMCAEQLGAVGWLVGWVAAKLASRQLGQGRPGPLCQGGTCLCLFDCCRGLLLAGVVVAVA